MELVCLDLLGLLDHQDDQHHPDMWYVHTVNPVQVSAMSEEDTDLNKRHTSYIWAMFLIRKIPTIILLIMVPDYNCQSSVSIKTGYTLDMEYNCLTIVITKL